jgi:hypothetical protein
MNNSSTMISKSIVDKVDMSQFYGSSPQGAIHLDCVVQFQECNITSKVSAFKRNTKELIVIMTCEQSDVIPFMAEGHSTPLSVIILAEDVEIFQITEVKPTAIDIDIKYLQDLNCQVKLTIQN